MRNLDLSAALVFVKVVEHDSFRAAARALGIPKSTASRKVADLEERLGARLLDRTTRTVRLTDAGLAYHRRVALLLEGFDEAERAVEELQAEPSGTLRLTATFEGGQVALGPVMAKYLRRYPAVHPAIVLTDRHVDLLEEGFDLALRAGALADSSLIARRLSPPGAFRIYASDAYLRRRGTPKRPEDLTSHDCLVMTSHHEPAVWQFREGKHNLRVRVTPRAEANSFVLLRDLAAAGLGLARLPDYIVGRHNAALRVLLEDFAPVPVAWHAVYPSGRHLSAKVRALVSLLEEHFARGR
jgi:DNA-binding transcriptional LysR family regulator